VIARVAQAAVLAASVVWTLAWGQGIYPGNAVRVNGVDISYQRFNGFYQEYQRQYGINVAARGDYLQLLTRLRREAMDLMVEQELVAQAAEQKGVAADPARVEAAVQALRDGFATAEDFHRRLETEGYTQESYRAHVGRMLAGSKYLDAVRAEVASVSDEELETYYRDNERRLTLPEQVRVRHILLTWKPMGTRDDRAAVREQMVPILEQARAGADFEGLARRYSEDSATASGGGDTGFFHRGQMVPAFEEAAFALQPGEVSGVVETPFGVHIIRLEERKEARLLPLGEIREPLREHVREERMEAAVQREIARLREEADVEVLIPVNERNQ
jgi:parvulin-like peptidyl-prolyl isomerase